MKNYIDIFPNIIYNSERAKYIQSSSLTHNRQEVSVMVTVVCLNKTETKSKNGKNLYFLDLLDTDEFRVYKALTTKKHYDAIEVDADLRKWLSEVCEGFVGYINFNNGYTNFYLPKDKIIG